jgi:hypothetical protein
MGPLITGRCAGPAAGAAALHQPGDLVPVEAVSVDLGQRPAFGVVLCARPGIGAITLALLFGLFNLIAGTWMLVHGTELRWTGKTLAPSARQMAAAQAGPLARRPAAGRTATSHALRPPRFAKGAREVLPLSDGIPARRYPIVNVLLIEANFGLFNAHANGCGVAFFAHVGGFIFGLLAARPLARAGQAVPRAMALRGVAPTMQVRIGLASGIVNTDIENQN